MNNTNLGKLGLCSCPGLLNTRPSRSSKTIQGNPTTDVAHLSAQGVTDVFVVCCFWEITHYNGWTNSEYCTALQNHGITVHWYEVQEAKAPSLEVSWSILKRSGLDQIATDLVLFFLLFRPQMCLEIHKDLTKCLALGKTTVIHSRKSLGRAATVLTTYLMCCHPELKPDIAIAHTRSITGTNLSIQTVKQYNHIHEFNNHQEPMDRSRASPSPSPSPIHY
jgi:hypothetical protein